MSALWVPIIAIFCVFVAPLWLILHYTTKRRTAEGLSREDERMLSELWQLAGRLERRVESLETILETSTPKWREKA